MKENILLKKWFLLFDDKKIETSVPNDILSILFSNGIIEDPYFGSRLEEAREYLKKDYVFVSNFDVDKKKKMTLVFKGVDTFSSIYLNGVYLGDTRDYFLEYRFDVSSLIKDKDNELKIVLHSVYNYLDNKNHGWALFNNERLQVRKPSCHFGWDWAPNLPGYGIHLPVVLETSDDEEKISSCIIETASNGDFLISIEIDSLFALDLKINLDKIEFNEIVKPGLNKIRKHIDNPKLWWPNGYGEQNLYALDLTLSKDGKDVDKKHLDIGFKTVSLIEDEFKISINGVDIFAKGSNWVPISNQTGSIKDEEYVKLLKLAKYAGFNMIRVWGGGFYEKDIFYSCCDKLGLLVFQDYMFACQKESDVPSFFDDISKEIPAQIKRIGSHPCLCLLSGGNELYYKKEELDSKLNKITSTFSNKLLPSLPYIPSSPFGFNSNQWDSLSGDSHVSIFEKILLDQSKENEEKYLKENKSYFVSECTCLGSSRIRSLNKFISKGKNFPPSKEIEDHFMKNPYALDPKETFVVKELNLAKIYYKNVENEEEFAKYSSLAQKDILKKEALYSLVNGKTSGFLNWMYNDNWGCGTWAIVDKYFEAKPAYYALKEAFAPFVIFYFGSSFYIKNSTLEEKEVEFIYGSSEFDLSKRNENRVLTNLKPNEIRKIDFTNKDNLPYLFAYLNVDGSSYQYIDIKKEFDLSDYGDDIEASIVENSSSCLKIKIVAKTFARSIFIDYEEPIYPSLNYFDLEKGKEIFVTIPNLTIDDFSKLKFKTIKSLWDK